MPRLVTSGRNRLVIVTRRYAIKLPALRCWRDFLFGLINNLNEVAWHREHPSYCPVILAAPLGLLLVMPRADILDDASFDMVAAELPIAPGAEHKASTWGWLYGRLVAVDYGWR